MNTYINRIVTEKITRKLKTTPVTALLGPRQCGKSTLAKAIISEIKNAIYLDLERTSDLNKLQDPERFFRFNADKLICLDEIQRMPEIFPLLRAVVDEDNRNGRFMVLGSSSPDLLKQTSESLAGRISFIELTPFLGKEIEDNYCTGKLEELWLRGGFPRSFLAPDGKESFEWRLDFIRTFLERDIPQFGFNIPARRLERFWTMCAHLQGQLLNASKLGESLGVSHHTVRSYMDILEQTFVLRVLKPFEANLKKRLIKSPKVYIRDTGLLHTLLGLETHNDLLGHPVYGGSWESFAIENILSLLPDWKSSFFRTSSGNEIDLILEKGSRRIAVECKASIAPSVGKGFWSALGDLGNPAAWIIAPVKDVYPIKKNVMVSPIHNFIKHMHGI